ILGVIVMTEGVHWALARAGNVATSRRYPDQPWLWRPDWAEKTCGRELRSSKAPWIIGIGYFVMLLPFVPNLLEKDPAVLAGFVAVGIVIFIWAAFRASRQRKQLGSICRLADVPIAPGSVAKGTIETRVNDLSGDFSV